MLNSTEKILNSSLKGHVIRDLDLANLFQGTPARRYGLVNKAIKQCELLPLRRGLYVLSPKYQTESLSLYYLANHIVPFSFVTAESALQFHQWIPERVEQVTSMAAFSRNKQFDNAFGQFIYQKSPLATDNFWTGVMQINIASRAVLMASPLRALSDYVYWHKINHADILFIHKGLRIETDVLNQISQAMIEELLIVYPSKSVRSFLKNLLSWKMNHESSHH